LISGIYKYIIGAILGVGVWVEVGLDEFVPVGVRVEVFVPVGVRVEVLVPVGVRVDVLVPVGVELSATCYARVLLVWDDTAYIGMRMYYSISYP
jgi:hypothetical protein